MNTSSDIASNSVPVIAKSLSLLIIPNSLAIAWAVFKWSPVIIIGLIPAEIHSLIEIFTSSRGGSIIPIKPIKFKSNS